MPTNEPPMSTEMLVIHASDELNPLSSIVPPIVPELHLPFSEFSARRDASFQHRTGGLLYTLG